MFKNCMLALSTAVILIMSAFTGNASGVVQLKHFPMDSLTGIITSTGVTIDKVISSDGHGSLKVNAKQGRTVFRLYEINDIAIENARLTYQARVRTQDVEGIVYLEMWCGFTSLGEFFSRNFDSLLSGTNNWSTVIAPFLLKKGEQPNYIKLNLVIEGKGTAWIDDIRLFKAPL